MKPVCHSTLLFFLLVITGSIARAQDDPNKDLVQALKKDDAAAAQAAISGGADINRKDAEGVTPLIYAASKCSPLMIKMLLHNRAEVNLRGVRDLTPLSMAAMDGRAAAVPLLIRAGADLNAMTVHGGTALMYAAYSGNLEIVEALVKAGADVSLKEKRGYTALKLAQQARKTDVIAFLQTAQNPPTAAPQNSSASKPAEKNSSLGSILLGDSERPKPAEKITVDQLKQGFHAKDLQELRECRAKEGEERWACVDEKLSHMAVNLPDENGTTFLMAAAATGDAMFARLLLKHKGDPNLKNKQGETALMIATRRGHNGIVHLINSATESAQKSSGAKPAAGEVTVDDLVDTRFKSDEEPLPKFTGDQLKHSFHAKQADELRECSAKQGEERWTCADEKLKRMDVNLPNEDGVTFLMAAAASGDVRFAKVLLAHKADPNLKDNRGETALMKATRGGHTEVIELLKQKPSVSQRSDAELQADAKFYLNMAALQKCKDKQDLDQFNCIEGILATVDDINYQDVEGKTMLMLAAEKDDIILTTLLLNRKPDVNLKDKKGETALMLANKNANSVLVNLLKRFGAQAK